MTAEVTHADRAEADGEAERVRDAETGLFVRAQKTLDEAAQRLVQAQKKDSAPSDRVRGCYEGGLTVWECARDLARFLADRDVAQTAGQKQGVRILELGCGHALPGVAGALKASASRTEGRPTKRRRTTDDDDDDPVVRALARGAGGVTLHLQDFNGDALKLAAAAAVRWNLEGRNVQVRYFEGSWAGEGAGALPANGMYDLVLSAECTYEESEIPALVETALSCLAEDGVWLDASKAHYFGVGGGGLALRRILERRGDVMVSEIASFTHGNVRHIVMVRWK